MTYLFVCDITSSIYGKSDTEIVLLPDFECLIEVSVDPEGLDLMTVTEVYVEGRSLSAGDDLAKAIRLQVMEKADEALAAGNGPFAEICEAECLSLSGHPNDPDTHWQIAAE
ncbi:MAG: hypothetical protein RLW68_00985 [Devosia marina]|uniref:hypothetical protein n=1 Tax=Devosia marina TaxID=2683198 RepID=UPI0032ED6E72